MVQTARAPIASAGHLEAVQTGLRPADSIPTKNESSGCDRPVFNTLHQCLFESPHLDEFHLPFPSPHGSTATSSPGAKCAAAIGSACWTRPLTDSTSMPTSDPRDTTQETGYVVGQIEIQVQVVEGTIQPPVF